MTIESSFFKIIIDQDRDDGWKHSVTQEKRIPSR